MVVGPGPNGLAQWTEEESEVGSLDLTVDGRRYNLRMASALNLVNSEKKGCVGRHQNVMSKFVYCFLSISVARCSNGRVHERV